MSKMFAICIPIVKGKEEAFKSFISDLKGKHSADFKESRKKLGVRERTFHQVTPMGEMVIVTLEGENPADAFAKFAAANDEFTNWFKGKVMDIHNIDLASPPEGPMPVLLIDTAV